MRLFRRNALGIYAVYAAAMVSGLVVTPILLDSIGTEAFGIWAFIGGITIYLAVLDIGLGPSVVRFTAEAHGRRDPEEINRVASVALVLYAAIGVLTLVAGAVLSWFVPALIDAPADLVWDARIATFLVTLSLAVRFPLGLFYNLLGGRHRFDLQNLGNFVATVLYAVLVALLIPRGGGLVLLGALTILVTVLRLGLPLVWLRRELPQLRLQRVYVTRARMRDLVGVSWSNFLVHVANKVVFSTDVVVVGIVLGAEQAAIYAIASRLFQLVFGLASVVTSLLYPAFAEYEGSGEQERQRRLLLSGLRGGSAAALVLALPLLLIPANLIHAWVGERILRVGAHPRAARARPARPPAGLDADAVPDRARPPARDRQAADHRGGREPRPVGRDGAHRRHVGCRARDAPRRRRRPRGCDSALGRAGSRTARGRALARAPAAGAAGARHRRSSIFGIARSVGADTKLELLPFGIAWALLASAAVWRIGLTADERRSFSRQIGRGGSGAPPALAET